MITNHMIESLAAYSHGAWAGWMKYQFKHGTHNRDGTFTIDADKVKRWTRQMETEYSDLPESEKASDRKEAREIVALVGLIS